MPKRVEPLTEKKIDDAMAAEKEYRLFDGEGLFLLVMPDGGKRWRFKYRFAGREKMLSFGVYSEVSLEDARGSRDYAGNYWRRVLIPQSLANRKKRGKKPTVWPLKGHLLYASVSMERLRFERVAI